LGRRSLYVTDRLAEHAADVVVLIDTYPQAPGPATEATERTVRGAMQVVPGALRKGDRAGTVTLGDRHIRWLAPDIGRRQFYRVLDAVTGTAYVALTKTTIVAALGFSLVGAAVAVVPLDVAWLPVVAPFVLLAAYAIAIYPYFAKC
jgi:uncharacterized protein (DUF58 family)